MLFGALGADYALASFLSPMSTFQMGMGSGYGIGVPPENHPASWFAAISGRKRWVFNPPETGTGRSGGPGTEPPGVMSRQPDKGAGDDILKRCVPEFKQVGSLMCDQQMGEIFWTPDYWWHETCGLDPWSIGIGGISYDGCCEDMRRNVPPAGCIGADKGRSYGVTDIAGCGTDIKCGTLPDYRKGTLEPTWMSV